MSGKKARFSVAKDIVLSKLVIQHNPFKLKFAKEKWTAVAEDFVNSEAEDGAAIVPSVRTCKERSQLIIRKFKQENRVKRSSSGTNEQYDELDRLLQECVDLERDGLRQQREEEEAKVQRSKEVEAKATKIRQAALKTMAPRKRSSAPDSASDDDEDVLGTSAGSSTGASSAKQRRMTASDWFGVYQKQQEEKNSLKRAELALRQKELEFNTRREEREREEKVKLMEALLRK